MKRTETVAPNKTTAKINFSIWRARRAAGCVINVHAVLRVCYVCQCPACHSSPCLSFHVCVSAQCWEVWSHVVCWGRSVTCWRWFWRGWTACPNLTTLPQLMHGVWTSSALLSTGTQPSFTALFCWPQPPTSSLHQWDSFIVLASLFFCKYIFLMLNRDLSAFWCISTSSCFCIRRTIREQFSYLFI